MTRKPDDVLALLEAHGERLYALLLRLSLRGDVADDLLQDLFCKLIQNPRFARADDPLAYASRMAINLAFDYRRRQRRQPALLDGDGPAAAAASPLAGLVRREELDQVLEAIGRLPGAGRDVLVLRYLEHQEFEAIGRAVGKTAHQARAICHKAITRLRRLLGEEAPDDSATKRQNR
ncbi:MAG TPA: sigma-70 family RNA polymerase sigma factor [Pirellulales bacterium]|nr:sigma-70 family RNA polymerase sigma factor [Pirellulales bacterium]